MHFSFQEKENKLLFLWGVNKTFIPFLGDTALQQVILCLCYISRWLFPQGGHQNCKYLLSALIVPLSHIQVPDNLWNNKNKCK